jgi:hypothetical protein
MARRRVPLRAFIDQSDDFAVLSPCGSCLPLPVIQAHAGRHSALGCVCQPVFRVALILVIFLSPSSRPTRSRKVH